MFAVFTSAVKYFHSKKCRTFYKNHQTVDKRYTLNNAHRLFFKALRELSGHSYNDGRAFITIVTSRKTALSVNKCSFRFHTSLVR